MENHMTQPDTRFSSIGVTEERGRNAWGLRTPSQPMRDSSVDTAVPNDSNTSSGEKKGSKSKDLSHVPCKFHKQGSCTAGKACPFSHDLTIPGTTKPICQWYAKGNCKFGHKCALAHILPGQPMSYDRKNKRAAQAALREAQAGQDPAQPNSSPSEAILHQGQPVSGLARSLQNSLDSEGGSMMMGSGGSSSNGGGIASAADDMVYLQGTSPSSPTPFPKQPPIGSGMHGFTFNGGEAPSYQSSDLAPPGTVPSGLSQTFLGSLGRSSIAAQVMLGQQTRRLSSNGSSLSPPRPFAGQLGVQRNGSGNSSDLLSSSPPTNVPGALSPNASSAVGSTSIFGTSPFRGSRALFLPSSYDSGDDFPGSPPRQGAAEEMRRASSSAWEIQHQTVSYVGNSAVDDGNLDDEYDEGFLPSSLNDLLTPEEQRRRAGKAGNTFDPFAASKSVPSDLMHTRQKLPVPSLPTAWGALNADSNAFTPANSTSYKSSSIGNGPLLNVHRGSRSSAIGEPPTHSTSFDPSSAYRSHLSPGTSPLPAPGSLPGGLAAGLSQLHLIPPAHAGDTPPKSGSSAGIQADYLGPNLHLPPVSPAYQSVWNGNPISWGSSATSDEAKSGSPGALSPLYNSGNGGIIHASNTAPISNIHLPTPISKLAPRGPTTQSHNLSVASPLHHSVRSEFEDEIQFEMDG